MPVLSYLLLFDWFKHFSFSLIQITPKECILSGEGMSCVGVVVGNFLSKNCFPLIHCTRQYKTIHYFMTITIKNNTSKVIAIKDIP